MSPRERARPVASGSVAELLRQIRDDAGITSGEKAGGLIGVTQATISRWENNKQIPSPEQADRYARALHVRAGLRRQLVTMVRDLHEQHRAAAPARVAVSRSAAHEQRVRRNEERSTHISVFHPVVVPGLLQTESYIRAIFTSGGLRGDAADARVAERLSRADLLDQPGRQFTFVLTSGALGWCAGNPETMIRQIEHVIEISHMPHVHVGVIPWGTPATAFPPYGFDLYDDHTVVVGVVGGSAYYNDPPDVVRHVAMLAELKRMAVFDDLACGVFERAAAEYRSMD